MNRSSQNKVVLVVDDDPTVRGMMSRLLLLKGFSVRVAEDGGEALNLLRSMPRLPCLVVLDLAMPIMDGREFLRLRARDPILCDIPVVVVSGNPQPGAISEGADACLRKPVDVDKLIGSIEHHCYVATMRHCACPRL
jgi:two-component system, chemotaxis family, chemotaxis protein CheY